MIGGQTGVLMGQRGLRGNRIPLIDKIGFGTGDFAYGVITQTVSTYIVFFSNAILGIPGSLVGFAVSISVMWDAVSDPLMGYLSDTTRSERYGKRHVYLLAGSLGIAVSNSLLWAIDRRWPDLVKFLAVLVCLLLVKTAITIFETPYSALAAELSSDYNERTSIQGIRTSFFLVGLMSATVMGFFVFFMPTAQYPVGQNNPDAYLYMGLTASARSAVFGLIPFYATRKYIPLLKRHHGEDPVKVNSLRIASSMKIAMGNRNYRHVVVAYLLTNISTAIISSMGIHIFTYTFGMDNKEIGILFGILFGISILSLPVWVRISRRIDKRATVLTGIVLSLCGCAILFAFVLNREAVAGNVSALLPFAGITGFGTGALLSLPYSMIADTIDVDELEKGVRLEGVYYGTMTFFYKFSQAVTVFLVGILLDVVRFDASAAVQPERTVMILGVSATAGGFVVLFLAGLSYLGYDLNRKKIADIQAAIEARSAVGTREETQGEVNAYGEDGSA